MGRLGCGVGRGLLQRLIELGVVFGGSLVSLEDRLSLGYMYFGGVGLVGLLILGDLLVRFAWCRFDGNGHVDYWTENRAQDQTETGREAQNCSKGICHKKVYI
jgi:hypothetical protein